MADLCISSRGRTARLTDVETVRLGRLLVDASATAHISYPDDTATAVVVVHSFTGKLLDHTRARISECLGDFHEALVE